MSIEVGKPINIAKKVLTRKDLPYLLSDGEIVEIIDDELIEYLYSPVILIGENKIEKKDNDYFIKTNNESIYTLRISFSIGIDFSSKNIQGQVLRVLGKEYVIGKDSTNSVIELVSDKKTIKLQNEENIKITQDKNGNVIIIEISFSPQNNIKVEENFAELTFEAVKLSFNNVNGDFADVEIGRKC